jgi:hypothetical protein
MSGSLLDDFEVSCKKLGGEYDSSFSACILDDAKVLINPSGRYAWADTNPDLFIPKKGRSDLYTHINNPRVVEVEENRHGIAKLMRIRNDDGDTIEVGSSP